MQYKVKEGLTGVDFINTKWNQSEWSITQKTFWQNAMIELGFDWPDRKSSVRNLNHECFYLGEDSSILYTHMVNNNFNKNSKEQKHFSDVFVCEEEQLELDLTLPKEQTLEELIERVENYPCSMSCYSTTEEMKSAQNMKRDILQILKGEL